MGEHRQQVDDFFTGLAQAVCESGNCDATLLTGQVNKVAVTYENCHPSTTVDLACHKELIDAISSPECALMSWGDYSGGPERQVGRLQHQQEPPVGFRKQEAFSGHHRGRRVRRWSPRRIISNPDGGEALL